METIKASFPARVYSVLERDSEGVIIRLNHPIGTASDFDDAIRIGKNAAIPSFLILFADGGSVLMFNANVITPAHGHHN